MQNQLTKLLAPIVLSIALVFPAQAADQPKTTIYVTSWCGYCRKLEGFLKKEGIEYARHDVEKDAVAAAKFSRLGGEGVPLVTVGSEVIHGYDPERILQALQR